MNRQWLKCLFVNLLNLTSKEISNKCIIGPLWRESLWRESTADWWIPLIAGQWCRNRFYIMASSRNDRASRYILTHQGPRQNGRHFPDDIFKCIFCLNENLWIPIKISLKFVPKDLINNIPSLVQIRAWRWPGDKPLSEPMMDSLLTHICIIQPQWVNFSWHIFMMTRDKNTCQYISVEELLIVHKNIWQVNSQSNSQFSIEAETQWLLFGKPHFQMHFLMKILEFQWKFHWNLFSRV